MRDKVCDGDMILSGKKAYYSTMSIDSKTFDALKTMGFIQITGKHSTGQYHVSYWQITPKGIKVVSPKC